MVWCVLVEERWVVGRWIGRLDRLRACRLGGYRRRRWRTPFWFLGLRVWDVICCGG